MDNLKPKLNMILSRKLKCATTTFYKSLSKCFNYNEIIYYNNFSTCTNSSNSILVKHAEFLNLVRYHGDGNIELNLVNENVLDICINNPLKRNAISGKMMWQFANIIDEIENLSIKKTSIIGIILRRTGKQSFCAGADLNLVKEIVNTSEKGNLMCMFMTDLLTRLRQSSFISVCCINGSALGGGSELITSCDFRIIPQNNDIYIQYVHAKLGASPGWGGIYRLINIIQRQNTIRLIASSVKVYYKEAYEMKLVDKIFESFENADNQTDNNSNHNKDNLLIDHNSHNELTYDEHCIDACIMYLQPYLQQSYPTSIQGIKSCIASHESMNDIIDIKNLERTIFMKMWGSLDNKNAINNRLNK